MDTAQVLADNLKRVTKLDGHKSVRGWAGEDKTLARNVSRFIKKSHSPSVRQLEEIVQKADHLQPWHLLLPGLDPANPPVITMTEDERKLYKGLKELAVQLPDK